MRSTTNCACSKLQCALTCVRRLVEQDRWARQQAVRNEQQDLWTAVGAVLAQFDGLLEGYNARVGAAARAAAAAGTAAGSWRAAAAANAGPGGGGERAARGQAAGSMREQEYAERVGFGARPVPPPLSRADLLMVSAVGAQPVFVRVVVFARSCRICRCSLQQSVSHLFSCMCVVSRHRREAAPACCSSCTCPAYCTRSWSGRPHPSPGAKAPC